MNLRNYTSEIKNMFTSAAKVRDRLLTKQFRAKRENNAREYLKKQKIKKIGLK